MTGDIAIVGDLRMVFCHRYGRAITIATAAAASAIIGGDIVVVVVVVVVVIVIVIVVVGCNTVVDSQGA